MWSARRKEKTVSILLVGLSIFWGIREDSVLGTAEEGWTSSREGRIIGLPLTRVGSSIGLPAPVRRRGYRIGTSWDPRCAGVFRSAGMKKMDCRTILLSLVPYLSLDRLYTTREKKRQNQTTFCPPSVGTKKSRTTNILADVRSAEHHTARVDPFLRTCGRGGTQYNILS